MVTPSQRLYLSFATCLIHALVHYMRSAAINISLTLSGLIIIIFLSLSYRHHHWRLQFNTDSGDDHKSDFCDQNDDEDDDDDEETWRMWSGCRCFWCIFERVWPTLITNCHSRRVGGRLRRRRRLQLPQSRGKTWRWRRRRRTISVISNLFQMAN